MQKKLYIVYRHSINLLTILKKFDITHLACILLVSYNFLNTQKENMIIYIEYTKSSNNGTIIIDTTEKNN